MKRKNIIYIISTIVILSNTPPIQLFIAQEYCYQNKDSSFRYCEIPEKSMDVTAGIMQFEGFKKERPTNPNTILYRTFKIRPWQFWEWWQYIAHTKRFTLPYLETDEQ